MTNTLTDTEKSKDLSKLLDISLSMIEKTDLSSLLGLIMEEATKTMHADRSTLYLVDRERNELVSFIAQQSGIKKILLPLGMGIAGHVAETGKTLIKILSSKSLSKKRCIVTPFRALKTLIIVTRGKH